MANILNQVYKPRFLDSSYGFKPERNCYKAILNKEVYNDKESQLHTRRRHIVMFQYKKEAKTFYEV